jgi:acetolactate synthase-1/2/3 large subunit
MTGPSEDPKLRGSHPSARSGGATVVESLADHGVTMVFGVPGESFLEVLDSLHDGPVRFISCRHEGGAAFMASGYAKVSGEVGVCIGTRAVGASNLAIGIHTARQDSIPMIAIAGQVRRSTRTNEGFQELDLVAVFAQYCKWSVEIDRAERIPELMAKAFLVARSGRPGPVFVSLPEDVLEEEVTALRSAAQVVGPPQPDRAVIGQMLARLLSADRPLIMAGGGVLQSDGAPESLRRFAEKVEVPVITTWRRHDAFPIDHRLALGSASLGQPQTVWDRIAEADVILAIGTRFHEITTQGYALPGPNTFVMHIDVDASSIGRSVPASMGAVSDANAALGALLAGISEPVLGARSRQAANLVDRATFTKATSWPAAAESPEGVRHAHVIKTLHETLPADGIVVSDGGNFYGWLSRYYPFSRPGTYVGPTSGAMGYGLPAGIGARLASGQRPVVCLAGDGGFMMSMQELETAARYGVPVIALVLDNQRHGTIRMHQERKHPGRIVGTTLGEVDFATMSTALGVRAWHVRVDEEFLPALTEALQSNAPGLIHVHMDRRELSVRDRLSESND